MLLGSSFSTKLDILQQGILSWDVCNIREMYKLRNIGNPLPLSHDHSDTTSEPSYKT
jgi:hypothetical protein